MDATILATRNGRLDSTDVERLASLKERLGEDPSRILLHLHGGLVDEAAGRGIANRLSGAAPEGLGLADDYEKVFVVWRTGAFETLGANWPELFENDRIYKVLLRRIIKFAARKLHLGDAAGPARGAAPAAVLSDEDIEAELSSPSARIPFAHVDAALGASPGSAGRGRAATAEDDDALAAEFEMELAGDTELGDAAEDLAAGLSVETSGSRAPLLNGDPVAGRASLGRLNPAIQDKLKAQSPKEPASRAVFTALGVTTFFVQHGVAIILRIVRRYRHKRGHGFYATVVEELARELYGDLVGATIWGMMKKDAADPFGGDATLAGAVLVDALSAKPWARMTITAHSAGSIWAASLLRAIAALPEAPARKIDLVLLAPAVRMDVFAETLKAAGHLIGTARMFTMEDALESADAVLGHDKGYIYPASLLYLVSGLFEEAKAEAFVDAPVLGMQRFLEGDPSWLDDPAQEAAVRTVQAFFAQPGHQIVYSKHDGGEGLTTHSDTHGGFDSEPTTVGSVAFFLR